MNAEISAEAPVKPGSPQDSAFLPPKPRRRWPRILLGLVIVLVFVAAGIVWQLAQSGKTEVLASNGVISRGAIISRQNLRVVEIDSDVDLNFIRASRISSVIGRIARNRIEDGTLIASNSFGTFTPLRLGQAIVGVALDAGQYPIQPLLRGDRVNVIAFNISPQGSAIQDTARVLARSAEVFDVAEIGGQTRLLVSLRVEEQFSDEIAFAASQGRIWLALVPG